MSEDTDRTTGPEPGEDTPASTPPAGQVGAPPTAPSIPPPASQLEEEALPRRYDNLRGQLMAYSSATETWMGSQQQIQSAMAQELATLRSQGAARTAEMESMRTELSQMGDLQARALQAETLEEQLGRLRVLALYPQIVGSTRIREVEGEDGQPQTVVDNPVLELLMTSTLTGEAFEQHVAQFVGQLQPLTPPQPPPIEQGGTRPPAPTGDEDPVQAKWAEYLEARNAGDWEQAQNLLGEYQELKYAQ